MPAPEYPYEQHHDYYGSHAPYEYEHHRDGHDDHFFYEPTFDFENYERAPIATNTGLGGAQQIFNTFEGKFRTENLYDDHSIDRSIEHLVRGEMSSADSAVKMWDSGIVDLITDNWSAVMEHSQIQQRSYPSGHHEIHEEHWPHEMEFDPYGRHDIHHYLEINQQQKPPK